MIAGGTGTVKMGPWSRGDRDDRENGLDFLDFSIAVRRRALPRSEFCLPTDRSLPHSEA